MSDKDGNIFGSETQTTEKKETTIAIPAEVSELVGEGKKYADVPTALKALVASQSHISTIESENEKLREQVKNGKTVDDIFDVVSNQSNQSDDEGKTAPVDTDKVVTEVVNVLEQRDKKKTAADNVKSASDQLTEKMGDQDAARKALETKAAELGVGLEFLMSIAAQSPKAFMQYFDGQAKTAESGSASSESSVNTQSMDVTRSAQQGTREWWANQRREKGDGWYFAPAQAKQRLDDASRLGREGFYGKR
jgi:hypothetical protein